MVVIDPDLTDNFHRTYGPFDIDRLKSCLHSLLCAQPANLHISFYLKHIKDRLVGE